MVSKHCTTDKLLQNLSSDSNILQFCYALYACLLQLVFLWIQITAKRQEGLCGEKNIKRLCQARLSFIINFFVTYCEIETTMSLWTNRKLMTKYDTSYLYSLLGFCRDIDVMEAIWIEDEGAKSNKSDFITCVDCKAHRWGCHVCKQAHFCQQTKGSFQTWWTDDAENKHLYNYMGVGLGGGGGR